MAQRKCLSSLRRFPSELVDTYVRRLAAVWRKQWVSSLRIEVNPRLSQSAGRCLVSEGTGEESSRNHPARRLFQREVLCHEAAHAVVWRRFGPAAARTDRSGRVGKGGRIQSAPDTHHLRNAELPRARRGGIRALLPCLPFHQAREAPDAALALSGVPRGWSRRCPARLSECLRPARLYDRSKVPIL